MLMTFHFIFILTPVVTKPGRRHSVDPIMEIPDKKTNINKGLLVLLLS
jgi:hypothetical protein